MSLTLYFDQDGPGPVARKLRRRGVDVVTAEQDGRKHVDDETLLQRAMSLGRILVSNDDDCLAIANRWLREGRHFAGIVLYREQDIPYRVAIEDLVLIAEVYEFEEMRENIKQMTH